jgi:cysteine desulfurase
VVKACKIFGANILNVVPDQKGILRVESILEKITEKTRLITFSYVNSELGALQDVKKISQAVKKYCEEKNYTTPYIFIDATQAMKYYEIDVHSLGVDALSFGMSKLGGVSGCAVLWVKNGVKIDSIISGGGQEEGLRSGTENLGSIYSNSFLLEKICDRGEQTKNRDYVNELRDYFIKSLQNIAFPLPGKGEEGEEVEYIKIFGDTKFKYNKFFEHAAPHIVMLSLKDMLGEELCLRLDAKGFSVSPGTACSLLEGSGSNFLKSIREPVLAKETIRVSFSEKNTKAEIDKFTQELSLICKKYVLK